MGRLIEIWSGQSLDVFLKERIFDPLGMHDTDFWCPEDKQERLAMLYLHFLGDVNPWHEVANATPQAKIVIGRWRIVARPRTTTSVSCRCCCAGVNWTACAWSRVARLD
jgi:CubicO group peptidase (beta-lactamase class C family)